MSTETDSFTSAPAIAGKDIPSLPIELHRRIFLLAPPRLSFGSFKERYELLCIASLVSNAWRKLALRELIRNPYLTRPKQESIFVKAACKVDSGFSKWGRKLTEKGKVESLWIGDCDGWREDMKVGSDFPCTVEVWMEGYSAEPVVIHPNEFRLSSSPSSATVHTNPVDEGQITRGCKYWDGSITSPSLLSRKGNSSPSVLSPFAISRPRKGCQTWRTLPR